LLLYQPDDRTAALRVDPEPVDLDVGFCRIDDGGEQEHSH